MIRAVRENRVSWDANEKHITVDIEGRYDEARLSLTDLEAQQMILALQAILAGSESVEVE